MWHGRYATLGPMRFMDPLHPVEMLGVHDLREKPSRPYAQERADGERPDQHPDCEISASNKTTTEAVFDREIKNDEIEHARDQSWRIGVPPDGPIEMNGKNVHDEPCDPGEWQDDPTAPESIEEDVTRSDQDKCSSIKPEEHSHGVAWPEVLLDPLDESAVQDRFIKYVNHICAEKAPEKEIDHAEYPLSHTTIFIELEKIHFMRPEVYLRGMGLSTHPMSFAGTGSGEFASLPGFHVLSHGLEVARHAIHDS